MKNWQTVEFIHKTNRGQQITTVIINCCCHLLVSSVSCAASSPNLELSDQWDVGVNVARTGTSRG